MLTASSTLVSITGVHAPRDGLIDESRLISGASRATPSADPELRRPSGTLARDDLADDVAASGGAPLPRREPRDRQSAWSRRRSP